MMESSGLRDGEARSDEIVPFAVDMLDIRGRTAQFGPAIDAILRRHAYPEPVARLLGEALALTALLGSSLKFEGKFILQTQTDGPVNLLVADMHTNGALRGYARFNENGIGEGAMTSADLLGRGVLALTIDQGEYTQRYQGLVELDGQSLEQAAIHYFRQSEQLPTVIRLAVAKLLRPSGADGARGFGEQWRVGGLIAQFMPEEPDRMRMADLPGGDTPDGHVDVEHDEDDAWTEARVLVDTIEDSELTDPAVGAERLLYRLFNQHEARIFPPLTVRDECSCSRDKIGTILRGFSHEERTDSLEDGRIRVTCEFCSTRYEFDPAELDD